MKKTKSVGILFAVITFLIIVITVIISSRFNQENEFTYRVIKVEPVYWGYEILRNDKVIIHQENIPAIQGKNKFNTQKDAFKVAELIVYRLNNKLSPGVSKKDIQELEISCE